MQEWKWDKLVKERADNYVIIYIDEPPKIFISFSTEKVTDELTWKWVGYLKEKLSSAGLPLMTYTDYQKRLSNPGAVPQEVRKLLMGCKGFIGIFSLSHNTVPVWPTFETGMAFWSKEELACFLTLVDEKFIVESEKDIGELHKLIEILKAITTYIPFSLNETDSKKIDEKLDDITNRITLGIENFVDKSFSQIAK